MCLSFEEQLLFWRKTEQRAESRSATVAERRLEGGRCWSQGRSVLRPRECGCRGPGAREGDSREQTGDMLRRPLGEARTF